MSTIDQVREIAARHSGRSVLEISESTRVFHDLAIDGDTAEEFLVEVFRRFGLSTEDFPFIKYFGSEIGAGWRHLIMVRLRVNSAALAPLTIGQIASWANSGSWGERHAA